MFFIHGNLDKILIGGLRTGQANLLKFLLSAVLGHVYTKHSHHSLALQQADCRKVIVATAIIIELRLPLARRQTSDAVSRSGAKVKKQPDLL